MPEDPVARRKATLAVALACALVAALLIAIGPPGVLAQDEEPEQTESVQAEEIETPGEEVVPLTRGDRFTAEAWELAVGDVFLAPSPTRAGYTDVRIAITLRSLGPEPLPYLADGFGSSPSVYPRLAVRDAAGVEYPLPEELGTQALTTGSMLIDIPVGLSGRWTVGFQVPTVYSGDLTLIARSEGTAAEFDLESPIEEQTFEPPQVPAVAMGQDISWGETFVARAVEYGSVVCGDPDSEVVTQVFALAIDVGNVTDIDATWPGARYPDVAAVAQWPNGASARLHSDTFAGDAELLFKWAIDAVTIPASGVPGQPDSASVRYSRAFIFGVPRDGRLGPVADPPAGVLLNIPDGTQRWLEMSGPGELAINPAYCDTGNFDFPIPYAFGPGPAFEVAPGLVPVDPVAADNAAQELLSTALVVAGDYVAEVGTYDQVSAAALQPLWSGVDFNQGFAGAGVGVVGVDRQAPVVDDEGVVQEPARVVLITVSATGTWFCDVANPDGQVELLSAEDEAAARDTCLLPQVEEEPPAEEEEPPAEEGTEGTEGAGTGGTDGDEAGT